jgi:rhamnulokinase
VVGSLNKETLTETGINGSVKLIAIGTHDTASAVAGTPLSETEPSAYLSCGTWSLLGMECDKPIITEASRDKNFTNEGGLEGKIRFLKNINGLWLIQRLLNSYNLKMPENKKLGFPELISEAEKANQKHFIIAPNDPSFLNPDDMSQAVRNYCVQNGQGEPQNIGETAMAVYNGLANEYNTVLQDLESLNGSSFKTLNMVGGGVKDTFLCNLTAKAINKPVVAGPIEASALGNIIAQLIGLGVIKNLREGRELIKRSFEPVVYNV